MTSSNTQRMNAIGVSFRRRARTLSFQDAVHAVRRGSAWLWLLTFLFVVQAHATHLHLPAPALYGAASLHAPVSSAEAASLADDSACTVCSTLATASHLPHTGVPALQAAIAHRIRPRPVTAAITLLSFDLFCRPPPMRTVAM